jgi:hypothetical protein
MNNSGQVSVELKLMMDSLRKQAKEASEILKSALKGGQASSTVETDKAKKSQDSLTDSVKKTTNALKDQKKAAYEAWKASLPAPQVYGVGGSVAPKTNYSAYGPTMNPTQGPIPAGGGGLATRPGYMGPTPPIIPPVAAVSAGSAGGTGATLAAAITAVSTAFLAAKEAIQIFVKAVRFVIDTVMQAAEDAKRLYAKSLTSGMSLGFASKRSLLADAIGVSEVSVYKYADAVKYLNSRLDSAASIMAQTTPELVSLSYEWAVVKADVSALISQLSSLLSPAIKGAIRAFDAIVRSLSALADLGTQLSETGTFKILNSILNPLGGALSLLGQGKVTAPSSSSNRIQASAWEKMGLVLGPGGRNHAEQTANNTKRIAGLTEKMLQHLLSPSQVGMSAIPSYP